MLRDNSPVVDGSLGPAGPYDEGQSIADVCRVSKPPRSARLLYSLAAEYRPQTVLELGTNVGISAAYLAAAGGQVTTFEASPYRLRLARILHQQLGLELGYVQGLFDETLPSTLERPWPNDAHVAPEHVDQLRQLIKARQAKKAPHTRDSGVVAIDGAHAVRVRSVAVHGPKLQDLE